MGKRIRVQRRGRGGSAFTASTHKRVAAVQYPPLSKKEIEGSLQGHVKEIVHEPGRGSPLALVQLENGQDFYTVALLAEVGITGTAALLALISATLLDLLLGLALLLKRHVKVAAWIQIAATLIYSVKIIVWALPEYWLHPFGPLIKNIPLVVATLMLIAMEE